MKPSRITPRKWFWLLLAIGLAWMILGQKFAPAPASAEASAPRSWLSTTAHTLLLPTTPLRWLQAKVETAGRATELDTASPDEIRQLREENESLRRQRDYMRQTVIPQYQDVIRQANTLASIPSLLDRKMIYAKVTGALPGVTQAVALDRGLSSGIRPGNIVLWDLALLGRVISANERLATVQLITDPSLAMSVKARLIRPLPATGQQEATYQTIVDLCQVRGSGDGQTLQCDSIDASHGSIPPRPGDILIVTDTAWDPASGTELGRVTEVSRLDNQNLRYNLKIDPMAKVGSQVIVVLGQ